MTNGKFMPAVALGLAVTVGIAIGSSVLVATVLSLSSLTEHSVGWVMTFFAFLALFIGGFFSGAKAKTKGWLAGGLTALLFSLLVLMVSYLGFNEAFTLSQGLTHLGYLVCASIGGMIGVNLLSASKSTF
ncbi:TIGR04086 family membrane protein [Shouchella shacheensis]|uniref:TIGR04086 family membrane protein n=1 Tax=Shouchella shacheensis TaxID=1649580 RepID=UPI0007401760|nr:TIGR04086 family membrane protein [Shouchella shacheensis]